MNNVNTVACVELKAELLRMEGSISNGLNFETTDTQFPFFLFLNEDMFKLR